MNVIAMKFAMKMPGAKIYSLILSAHAREVFLEMATIVQVCGCCIIRNSVVQCYKSFLSEVGPFYKYTNLIITGHVLLVDVNDLLI